MVEKTFWLGSNQLVIVPSKGGTYRVIEEYENYGTVFSGSFNKCYQYCKNREMEYKESIIF